MFSLFLFELLNFRLSCLLSLLQGIPAIFATLSVAVAIHYITIHTQL